MSVPFMPLRILIRLLRLRRRYFPARKDGQGVVKHLLICELTRMGDVITIVPVLQLLRNSFPSSTIHVVADESYIDTLRAFQKDIVAHGIHDSSTPGGAMRAWRVARTIPADLACSMSPSRRNAWVVLSSRAPAVVGYLGTDSSLTPYLFSYPVEGFGIQIQSGISYGMEPMQLRALKIARALGISSNETIRQPEMHTEIIGPMEQELRERRSIPDAPFVAIQPFAGWEYRSWPLERFGWLAREIITQFDRDVVFLYTHGEEPQIASLRAGHGDNQRIHFVLSENVLESAVIIRRAELFVGNDSGPLHLASAVGTRHVGLFGPADPQVTSPAHPLGRYLFKELECSPCRQITCSRPHDPCMRQITTGEVFASVSTLLETDHSTDPASYG